MASAENPAVIPVRLTCRYTNGMLMAFSGRAISYDGEIFQVLTTENFEKGISLTAICSLLARPAVFQVARSARSPEQVGFFQLTLRIVSAEVPAPQAAPALQPPLPAEVPAALGAAAAVLADLLVLVGPKGTLSDALEGLRPEHARVCLWAAAAAVLFQMQSKGWADPLPLVRSLKGAP